MSNLLKIVGMRKAGQLWPVARLCLWRGPAENVPRVGEELHWYDKGDREEIRAQASGTVAEIHRYYREGESSEAVAIVEHIMCCPSWNEFIEGPGS